MASCVNKVFLIGRLGRDPEIRSTSSGQDVANFTIATDESYIATSGEKIEKTEWHRISAWGKQAEFAAKYLKKGSLVYVEGKIENKKWKDQNGIEKVTTEIISSRLTGLDSKDRDPSPPGPSESISIIDQAPF